MLYIYLLCVHQLKHGSSTTYKHLVKSTCSVLCSLVKLVDIVIPCMKDGV